MDTQSPMLSTFARIIAVAISLAALALDARRGFNPCRADTVYGTLPALSQPNPTPVATPATVQPTRVNPAVAFCSGSYPYFHAGKCYANPVRPAR